MADLSADFPQDSQLDKYDEQMLENGQGLAASEPSMALSGSDILHKLSFSLLNSLQQPAAAKQAQQGPIMEMVTEAIATTQMDFDVMPNHVVIDSSTFGGMDEMQKQLQYDKLMNEVWIGVVFTLIMISLVFCVCSCFLYHQFRTWKKNFNATAVRAQAGDLEAMKLNPDYPEDPVPSYTLVSGLPSYDAALELLHKNPNGCVFVYPTVFSVFNKQGISCNDLAELMTTPPLAAAAITAATFGVQQQQHQPIYETHRSLMAAERAVRSFSPYDGSIINENNSNENNNNENHSNETNNNETSVNGNIKTNDNITSNINTNDSNIPRYADAATTTATLAPPPPPPTTTINMILSEQCNPSDLATVEEVGAAASTRTTTKPFRVAPTYPVLQIVHSYEEAEALLVASDVRF